MRRIILSSLLLGLCFATGVSAATLTPEASANESIKKAQARIKTKETERANALQAVVNEVSAQIAALNKEQAERLKGLKDAAQIAAIRKSYAEQIAKLKSQQGVRTKQINDSSNKTLIEMRAEVTALQKQQVAERKSRERDALKARQEQAKKLKKAPSAAELEKARAAEELAAEKQLKATASKRAAEQAAWQKRDQGGKRVILDLSGGSAN
jgi:hypothetical protein